MSQAAGTGHMADTAAVTRQRPRGRGVADGLQRVATALCLIAACATTALLYFAAPVLLPLVLAVFLFYALDPLVTGLERAGVARGIGATIAVLTVIAVGGASGVALWPQADAVIAKVPLGAQRLRSVLREAQTRGTGPSALTKVQDAARAIDRAAAETTARPAPSGGALRVEISEPLRTSEWLWAGGIGAVQLSAQALMVLFLTVFLLSDGDAFKRKLVSRMETLGSKRITVQILHDIAHRISQFIWVQVITSAGVAAVTGVVLWWLAVEQPAVWGVFAGVLNIVPYFGPLIVTVVLAAVGFLQFGTLAAAGTVAGAALVITTVEGLIVTPHLLSRAGSLNHVAIFVAIAFWSWLWGAAGMLLAVPLLMAAKAVCDHVDGLQSVGVFLGE